MYTNIIKLTLLLIDKIIIIIQNINVYILFLFLHISEY